MTLTKRLGLGALLVVAMALFTSTPVLAQSTITLTNTAGPKDRDSGASGQATLSDVAYYYSDVRYGFYTGYLTVSCSGPTPGATYRIGPTAPAIDSPPVYSDVTYSYVTASDTGTVELALQVTFVGSETIWEGDWYNGWWFTWHPDYWLSVDRKQRRKYIVVLQGSFPYPY